MREGCRRPRGKPTRHGPGAFQDAAALVSLLNAYTLDPGPPKTIRIPNASRFASLQDTTVAGTLLKKEQTILDPATGRRTFALDANGGAYDTVAADGDLHFCIGTAPLAPFLVCEMQNGRPWLGTFNGGMGRPIAVTGFFRCLFEHPGFLPGDDAHVFEIHPVRAFTLGGHAHASPVELPDPASIHTWTSPHPLNIQDDRIRVSYDSGEDALVFTGMDGQDENYVRVPGVVGKIQPSPGGSVPASFTLTSPDIGHPIQVLALTGTAAALQLSRLNRPQVSLVGLRNIDLGAALQGRYLINLVAIDLQPA